MLNIEKQPLLMFILTFIILITYSVAAQEQASQPIIFSDVEAQGANYWARSAIYQMASRSIIKGNANGLFNPFAPVTREEVFAFLYRILGKEAEAQQCAEYYWNKNLFDNPNGADSKSWWLGYLILAEQDGLIEKEELEYSLQFHVIDSKPAQRQEVAVWTAKLLRLEPVYSMQIRIDSFWDGIQIDPLKRPYVEPVLRNGIMNGSEGYILPRSYVLREQMAQLLVNIEKYISANGNGIVKPMDELLSEMDFDSVYKGNVYFYDPYTATIVVNNASKWENNSWYPVGEQTYTEFAVENKTPVFSEDKKIILHDINNSFIDCEAYFAVKAAGDGSIQVKCIIFGSTGSKILAQ